MNRVINSYRPRLDLPRTVACVELSDPPPHSTAARHFSARLLDEVKFLSEFFLFARQLFQHRLSALLHWILGDSVRRPHQS